MTAFTPAANDLLVVLGIVTGTAAAIVVTDDRGGTYTTILTGTPEGTHKSFIAVRNSLAAALSTTITVACTGDAGTGCGARAFRVAGMTRVGSGAVLQSAKQDSQSATGTPAPTFGSAVNTNNPTIGGVFNATNPAGLTPPTGWTEDPTPDLGFTSPTTGHEYVFRNSGFTGTTVTWGSASDTAFCDLIVELDASVLPSGDAIFFGTNS